MTFDDGSPDDPVVPLEELLDSKPAEPEEPQPNESNVFKFPVKLGVAEQPKPQIKYRKGDWIRYYGSDGRLSIAQVEYIMLSPNSVMFLTDRGLVPDNMIVEARRTQE